MGEPNPLLNTLLNKQLLIVTGKGGVGKSAVAAALAYAAARNGRRALLASYSRIDEPHPFFGMHMPYQPAPVTDGLHLCRIEAHEALKEYVHRTLPLGNLYDWFLDSRALAHFTEAAPGFDELMCLGKVYDHVEGSDAFDLVVLDAPATGHAALMLGVPAVTGRAVGTGPLHHNALKIQLLLESTRTEVVLVALAEEMALREADEMSHRIKTEFDMSVGALVLNRITTSLFDDEEMAALTRLAPGSDVPSSDAGPVSEAMTRMIDAARERHALATQQRQYEAQFSHADARLRVPHVIQQRFDGAALVARIADHLAAPQ